MTTTRKRIQKAATKLARKAGSTAVRLEQRVEKGLRRQRGSGVMREAGKAALAAGAAVLAARTIKEAGALLEGRARKRQGPEPISFSVTLPVDQEQAVARLTDGLKAEGFGILTRIDVQQTFREKLGTSFRPYLILGVCNPNLAHRALAAVPEAGLLLPCTVTVEEAPGGSTLVRIADPTAMLAIGDLGRQPELAAVARQARAHLERVVATLTAHAGAVIL